MFCRSDLALTGTKARSMPHFTRIAVSKPLKRRPFLLNTGLRCTASPRGERRGELGANAAMIAACPQLEGISVYGVSFDAVDLDAWRVQGIRVTSTPDVLTKDVADLGIAMMLVQSCGMIGAETWMHHGSWATQGIYPLQRKVRHRRAGVLGLGHHRCPAPARCDPAAGIGR